MCGGNLAGARVGVLGAAFKPDSDDIRDSPALDVVLAIQQAGAAVRVYDPYAMDNARIAFPTLAYAASATAACHDADVVLHLTEWQEFRDMDPSALSEVVRVRNIVDARNALDRERWTADGWIHRSLGRRSI
ncbi:MAG: UDP binding domain-containing protein, partial [Lapillicoccus sp.]